MDKSYCLIVGVLLPVIIISLFSVDESGHVVTSTILGFMDRRPKETALYVTLRTSIGRNLTLSPNHVLFKSSPNSSQPISVFGSDINIGDVIYSANETGLQRTEVVGIDHDVTIGRKSYSNYLTVKFMVI